MRISTQAAWACRVIKEGGLACLIGPVHPTFWLSRLFADAWMLFPTEDEYTEVQPSPRADPLSCHRGAGAAWHSWGCFPLQRLLHK